jgi:hypothetical protein
MYHLVYLTTNQINSKIYVGIHSTYNLNDDYLGSGELINKSIKKYGKENFKKTILYVCLSRIDALEIESKIVDKIFVEKSNTYNMGIGGITYKSDENHFLNKKHSEDQKIKWSNERKGTRLGFENSFFGKTHSEHSKNKIAKTRKIKNIEPWNKGKKCKPCSEEQKKKISETSKNNPKLKCEFCGKLSDPGNHKKNHGENCKMNPNYIKSKYDSKKAAAISLGRLNQKKEICEFCGIEISIQNLNRHIKAKHITE